jgi:hypothetical protein
VVLVRTRTPLLAAAAIACASCGSDPTPPLATALPGVLFTFPANGQLDVPLGSRIVVSFSEQIDGTALGPCSGAGDAVSGAFCLVGPDGAVDAIAQATPDGTGAQFVNAELAPGTTYSVYVRRELDPVAENLPATGPLVTFTTRSDRPRAAPPELVAVNGGGDQTGLAGPPYRPMLDTSTINLLFSEPLDPRSVALAPGSIELVDAAGGAVPATLYASGIHVAIDPIDDLTAGATYTLRVGTQVADLAGDTAAAATVELVPADTAGTGRIAQVLRTRQPGDPGPASGHAGAQANLAVITSALIGDNTCTIQPGALATELGDPKALDGPIAFTIRRGQRIRLSGLDVHLGGEIPAGLRTDEVIIELLTDAGGRIFRNPHQAAEQRPENERAPLYVDLTMDLALYALDPAGNAALTQTVLGVQGVGTAVATDGVLAIEAVSAMELGLLGVTSAPTNLVLELITDLAATPEQDTTAPELLATSPPEGSALLAPDGGIELVFSEPIDLDRARAGGITLFTAGGATVASAIESHGAAIVVRPRSQLADGATYRVVFDDVADVAGNALADDAPVEVATPALVGTDFPLMVVAAHPGVPCTLTGGTNVTAGRCSGGQDGDDLYRRFTLARAEPVEVVFSQPPSAGSVALGGQCGAGAVRVEQLDASGACTGVVAGTFLRRDRSFRFVPDTDWVVGQRYRLTLVAGTNASCSAGEICGLSGDAANFDPLAGDGAGGTNLVIDFTGGEQLAPTYMMTEVTPVTDTNGSGTVDNAEPRRDENRAALRITGTTDDISSAEFTTDDCIPSTGETEACLYLLGAMPVEMGELSTDCPLPDGTTAPSCIPVTLSPQVMYGTSMSMDATVGIAIGADTETTVIRIREPASGGPVMGYIVDRAGAPTLELALDLYMDAPDMSILLSDHDLHSKPLSVHLRGPVEFLPDGRIVIGASNTADVPVSVNISAPLGLGGAVNMIIPAAEMKLQLVSPPLRGGAP